jgi:hypothetical protein
MTIFFYYSPLSLVPFPPKGAREFVAPPLIPAPSEGRMSEGQEGGFIQQSRLFAKASIDIPLSFQYFILSLLWEYRYRKSVHHTENRSPEKWKVLPINEYL